MKHILLSRLTLLIGMICFILLPQYQAEYRPFIFTPYLCSCIHTSSRSSFLYKASTIGLLFDLTSSMFFGLHILIYSFTGALLYPLRRWLLEDTTLFIPAITCIFSITLTMVSYLVLPVLDYPIPTSIQVLKMDFQHTILCDLPYALAIYMLPLLICNLYYQIKKSIIGYRS